LASFRIDPRLTGPVGRFLIYQLLYSQAMNLAHYKIKAAHPFRTVFLGKIDIPDIFSYGPFIIFLHII